MREFDIVVVGGGGSGLAVAARSVELGLSVAVLEKQPSLGGTTGIAVGSFTANGTRHQARAGVSDSVNNHVEDASKFAAPAIESRNNDELRRFFLTHAAATLDWLEGIGLSFHGPSPEPPNRVPRMHNVIPNAQSYISALQSRVLRGGGQIHCRSPATRLVKSDNRVTGVTVVHQGAEIVYAATRGVVLAAGDYASSQELIARFKGTEFSEIAGINPDAQGDGHRLAEEAGARLVNMDITYGPELRFVPPATKWTNFSQLLPTSGWAARILGSLSPLVPRRLLNAYVKRLLVTWQHPEDKLLKDGAVLINQGGVRFCDECKTPDRELAVAQQPEGCAFILLDERLIERFSTWPNFVSTAPEIAYAYVSDYLKLRPDITASASSLAAVASLRGIPSAGLQDTVRTINNERCASGQPQLNGSRWVLLGPVRSYFTTTEGGAAINQSFAVLNAEDEPIQGLYAVGQNGLGGQILWGHGLHIAWAMTSGRMVAEHLASLRPVATPRA